jgi:hypothetical protein
LTTDIGEQVPRLLGAHGAVRTVTLAGSRARGESTTWSDWDFDVKTDDFEALAADLPAIVAPLRPLAALWDPLSDEQTYMLILDGPVKVDLLFDVPHAHHAPYVAAAETMRAIDDHFWDWTLWLTSKVAHGKADLVRGELEKMAWFILSPLGVDTPPTSLRQAVDLYLAARDEHARRFGVDVPRELGNQVAGLVRRMTDQTSSA